MMKYLFLSLIVVAFSCKGPENNEDIKPEIVVSSGEIEKEQTEVPAGSSVAKPGPYTEYHPNGEIKMKGIYNDNLQREGLWVAYYDNGIKWSESYYTNGIPDGHSLTFYPNGNIRYIGEYKDGEKTGAWTFYDESGNITKEEKY